MAANSVTGAGQGSAVNYNTIDLFKSMMYPQNCIYVARYSNHIHGANKGRSIHFPCQTFKEALETSMNIGVKTIICLDASVYDEGGLFIPNDTQIFAPYAKILGSMILGKNVIIHLNTIENTGDESIDPYSTEDGAYRGVCIQQMESGRSFINIDKIISNGVAGVVSLINNSIIFVNCNTLIVNGTNLPEGQPIAVGLGATFLNFNGEGEPIPPFGHMHISIKDLYINCENGVGIGSFGETGNLIGHIDHILPINNTVGGVGIFTTGGVVNMNINEIKCAIGILAFGDSENAFPKINLSIQKINTTSIGTVLPLLLGLEETYAYRLANYSKLNLIANEVIGTQSTIDNAIAKVIIPS